MVGRELADGRRVAQLLASELTGRERGPLAALSLADVDSNVEPTDAGAHAYDVVRGGDPIAEVFVSPARARVEFAVGLDDAKRRADARRDAALARGLRRERRARETSPRRLRSGVRVSGR